MGQGLGKNSPVILSLGCDSFEGLIDRHGQLVRWRCAKKCPCLTNANQPDVHCKKCGGSGFIYDYQKSYITTFRVAVFNYIAELPAEYKSCKVVKAYNYVGAEYEFIQAENYLQFSNKKNIRRGEQIDLVLEVPIVLNKKNDVLVKVAKNYYKLKSITAPKSKLQGVYYTPHSDILSIEKICDENDEVFTATAYCKNAVLINETDTPLPDKLYAFNVQYINPFKFIILSQNLNKETQEFVQKHSGDAVCTFPYYYDVAEGDVITVLSGTMTNKVILKKKAGDDIIPEFFIESIKSVETTTATFVENKDFILTGTNVIHWLDLDNAPKKGEAMSIVYRYNPTYKVCQNIPMLRTSEDQRIPRKVVIKLFSTFQESASINFN